MNESEGTRATATDSPLPGGLIRSEQYHSIGKRTRRYLRSFRENLELGTLLAFVAGTVNTVGFLQFGTYVSHISGHATRTAVEYAEGNIGAAFVFFLETIAFILGAMVTALLMHGHTAADRREKYARPILLELLLIVLFLIVDHVDGLLWIQIDQISLATLLLAHAMGVQNAILRHASGAIIRTTHMTGVATDIGVAMGTAFHAARLHWSKDKNRGRLRWKASLSSFWRKLGVERFTFHSLLLFTFFLGAVIGTIGYVYLSSSILVVPCLILTLLALQNYARKTRV